MRVNGWLDYVGGIVTVKIRGTYPEKLINLALSRGIYLSGVKRDGSDITFRLRKNGVKALQNIAEPLEYEVEITGREGLPFYRRVLRERWMLIGGAIIFILTLYGLTSLVWHVDVVGTSHIRPNTVLESAARYGLHQWAWKYKLDKNRVEEGILRDVPELSYAQVNTRGINAHIKVVEKILPDQTLTGPCNLTASSGGIVEEVLVLEGKSQVKKGDAVDEGDILISGIVTSLTDQVMEQSETPPRLVRARGVVKARVLYEGYGEQPMEISKRLFTGRKEEQIILMGPEGKWVIKKPDQAFQKSVLRKYQKKLKTPWGTFGITRQTWLETRNIYRSCEADWALEKARQHAVNNLNRDIKNEGKVLETKIRIVSSPSDTIIRVKATVEVLKDICQPQPLNIEENVQ